MTPGPAAAAAWVIQKMPRTHPPIDPEQLIVNIGMGEGWFASPDEAQEKAERWRRAFLNRLRIRINDPERLGRFHRFEFNSSSSDLIQGACYEEDADSDELKESKADRQHIDTYRDFIRALTGRQFEGVCHGVLMLLGCDEPALTPRGNDQGIDFYGHLQMRGRLNKRYVQVAVDVAMNTWIVGQAKQIEGKVSTPEIRDLIGAVEMARVGVSADEGRALAELGMKPFDSVMRFFITTGEFSKDASKLVNRLGLVGMDGEMVATLLADHRIADVNGAPDRAAFDAWVQAHLPDGEA